MSADNFNEQLRELVRQHGELLADQKESFAKLIALQTQVAAKIEQDLATRRKLLRVMVVLVVVYLVLTVVPIWLRW